MNTSIFSSEQILKWLFTAVAMGTRPTSWYVSLHTGDPSLDGSDNESTDTNYARQAVAFTASQDTAGDPWQAENDADLVFPGMASATTITHVAVFDATTGGNCLAVFELPLSRSVDAGGVFTIP